MQGMLLQRTVFGLALTLGASALSVIGCSSDSNSTPTGPVIVKDKDGGAGGSTSSSSGGSHSGGGGSSAGGSSAGGSSAGGSSAGGSSTTEGGGGTGGVPNPDSGAGGTGAGGGPACDPSVTGTNPPACFGCPATTTVQFYNHCTSSQCAAFDATRLPTPLPTL